MTSIETRKKMEEFISKGEAKFKFGVQAKYCTLQNLKLTKTDLLVL